MWPRPLLFGHRGSPAQGIAENTLASFDKAVAEGVSALETDVHRTADGHVVISHDENLTRVFGVNLEIKSATLADVQRAAPVPTLAELLGRFTEIPINVDIKQREPRIESDVVRAIDAHAARVLLASFHSDVLGRVRALGYRGPTGLSRDEVLRVVALPAWASRMWPVRGARAQVPRRSRGIRFDSRAFIDKCRGLGIAVDYWTINDVDEARELLALGADGIMSDVPGELRAAFR